MQCLFVFFSVVILWCLILLMYTNKLHIIFRKDCLQRNVNRCYFVKMNLFLNRHLSWLLNETFCLVIFLISCFFTHLHLQSSILIFSFLHSVCVCLYWIGEQMCKRYLTIKIYSTMNNQIKLFAFVSFLSLKDSGSLALWNTQL